jgi:excisionase family DNA binding protein
VRKQGEKLPAVMCDPAHLQQAFLNILINAEHAVPTAGRRGASRSRRRSVEPRKNVTVTDPRLRPGHRGRVMPGSSTRSSRPRTSGQGTGLGWPSLTDRSRARRDDYRRERQGRRRGVPDRASVGGRVIKWSRTPPQNDGRKLPHTEEVLEYLQVNLRTVYRLIKAGKIPAVRVGRQWRFRKRDIDAWLETQRPRGSRAAQAPAARPASTAAGGRPRVLVVDDEATIRDLLSKTLALAEYDVDLAPDGRTALERLRIIPYDLLITDLKMPGVDGLTVIREARRLKADLPVIIITGFSNEASAIEAVNLGVSGYLTKPFRVPRVLAAASKALGE